MTKLLIKIVRRRSVELKIIFIILSIVNKAHIVSLIFSVNFEYYPSIYKIIAAYFN